VVALLHLTHFMKFNQQTKNVTHFTENYRNWCPWYHQDNRWKCIYQTGIPRYQLSVIKIFISWSFLHSKNWLQHLLRHRNSASTSVVSKLKSVCLSVKTTLRLFYWVLEMTLWVSFWYFWVWFNWGTWNCPFQQSIR
jgi:hypothetical protein